MHWMSREDRLYENYIEWLESHYSGPQIDDGECPSFDEWLDDELESAVAQ